MKTVELSRPFLEPSRQSLKCVVITPIGPGHETLAKEARISVQAAFRKAPGPFSSVTFLPLPDLEGKIGRSARRNDGIDYALANDFDWIFFLDADDFMAPDSFAAASPYLQDYDAVFGVIAETKNREVGETSYQVHLRPNQIGATTSIADIVRSDPFLTIQMGHFVRAKAAAAVRFDVAMNAGEDFKYYLTLWRQFRCTRIDQILFINRRGAPSSGPRSADWKQWRESVTRMLQEFSRDHNVIS